MNPQDGILRQDGSFGERLPKMHQAGMLINRSLDFDAVLLGALDSARTLTCARYAVITLLDGSGHTEDYLSSGFSTQETERARKAPEGWQFLDHLNRLREPLRTPDLFGHLRSLGIAEFQAQGGVGPILPFMFAPIVHGEEHIGNFFLARDDQAHQFTQDDEKILMTFASPAAWVIFHARLHGEERRALADLEMLVDSLPVGLLAFDSATGLLRMANRAARRIGGVGRLSADEPLDLLGNLRVLRRDGAEFTLSALALTLGTRDGRRSQSEELALITPAGTPVPVLVNAVPMHSPEGEPVSVVMTVHDISLLDGLERLRTDYLAMVSHELRVPLAAIKGSASSVLDDPYSAGPAEMRQYFRIIADQADHIRGLINDLLLTGSSEAAGLPAIPVPTAVADLVDEASSLLLDGGDRDRLTVQVGTILPRVMADRRHIAQVLHSLLENAVRHSPEGTPIQISAALDGDHVTISVTDQGSGIPADRLPYLFTKFSGHHEPGGGQGAGGTALSLAVCKDIVEAHGGRICAESEGPGRGSCFTFTVPVAEELGTDPGNSLASGASSATPAGHARVLVVDDDPPALRHLRDVLAESGFRPLTTGDPSQVQRMMTAHGPELVLLDLLLPGAGGIELMQQIHEAHDVPVIFISAYCQEDVVARAFDLGAADYVAKPFSPVELGARIRSALRRSSRPEPDEPFVSGSLVVDYRRRRATLSGEPLSLTPTEYQLLAELATHAGHTLTYTQLLQQVWRASPSADRRSVRTAISNLRSKLGADSGGRGYIVTEPRVGYRMDATLLPSAPDQ